MHSVDSYFTDFCESDPQIIGSCLDWYPVDRLGPREAPSSVYVFDGDEPTPGHLFLGDVANQLVIREYR